MASVLANNFFKSFSLILATIYVLVFFVPIVKNDFSVSKLKSVVETNKLEILLRSQMLINFGEVYYADILQSNTSRIIKLVDVLNLASGRFTKNSENSIQQCQQVISDLKPVCKLAYPTLENAVKQSPEITDNKVKLAVLYSLAGENKEKTRLICQNLEQMDNQKYQYFGKIIKEIFLESKSVNQTQAKDLRLIEEGLTSNFYYEIVKLKLLQNSHDAKYPEYCKQLQKHYVDLFNYFVYLCCLGLVCLFIGLITILVQLGKLGRINAKVVSVSEEFTKQESLSTNISIKSIYSVFIAWLSSLIAIKFIFKFLPGNLLSLLQANILGQSFLVFFSYIINMFPALLAIYLIVIKPNKLNAFQSLFFIKQEINPRLSGLFKLIISGILSWTAIIPFVLLTSLLIKHFCGTDGSDNPILVQIVQAASSKNYPAMVLYFISVSVLAPICEEILFRGFLYKSLRNKIGIFPAMLISAAIFSLVHFDKSASSVLFMIGIVLALSFERTSCLVPPIIAHGLWNGMTFFFILLLFQ